MKMGIKEFRDRISEVTERGEPVIVTNHGKEVATYLPRRTIDLDRARKAADEIKEWQRELRAKGIEPEDILAEMGLDPWGVPLDESDR
jgi:antitoxin (DNA-binding transcriptional repressor) of toxin-antitoxin stability system